MNAKLQVQLGYWKRLNLTVLTVAFSDLHSH